MPVPDGSTRCVDMKVNHKLLDPHFDGYKLTLDPLPVYNIQLDNKADVTCLTEKQYSYQHAKAFGSANLLYTDPWCPENIYLVDDHWKLLKYTPGTDGSKGTLTTAWQIPNAATERGVTGRVAVTVTFPTAESVVIADGTGHLYILNTNDRNSDSLWKIEYNSAVLGDEIPFSLLHCTTYTEPSGSYLECLLLHVDAAEQKSSSPQDTDTESADVAVDHPPELSASSNLTSQFTTVLEWLTFISDKSQWNLQRTRRFNGSGGPDYAAIDDGGAALILSSEKSFTVSYDSMNPVEDEEENVDKDDLPSYTWSQTNDDITIQFTLPPGVSSGDVQYQLGGGQLSVGLTGGTTLLQGTLCRGVDSSSCTWTISDGNRLEVYLSKNTEGPWPQVVEGDSGGQMVANEEEAATIHERLAHLTAENWNADPTEGAKPAYNSQQLEDCDVMGAGDATVTRFDGESHRCTHKVNLGSRQWLFTMPPAAGKPPSLCIRHDVDGLLWQPSSEQPGDQAPWLHVATLKAFGYVQASKQQRRYCLCSPDFSYAVICDSVRHVYIYRQHSPVDTELRNRKTGHQVSSVCKQQLISLDSTSPIIGAQCSNEHLFLLVDNKLYVVGVSPPVV